MKLYYYQNTCALGIHVILEETGAPYTLETVDFTTGAQYKPPFIAINPKSKVPALVLDNGQVLTEWPAIASWIAATHPEHHLLPAEPLSAARTLETVLYINGTMHVTGFGRIIRPAAFSANPEEKEAVRAQGRDIFAKGFALVSETLGVQDYLMGDFTIADAALFYVTYWNKAVAKLDLPANIGSHYARMLARPAVQKAMQTEGIA